MPANRIKAAFIEPMLLMPTDSLPEGNNWAYELKLDGYRALGIKSGGKVYLRSRNNKDFNHKYPSLANALETLPEETVIDGEVVALDEAGRPSFNTLQNGATSSPLYYFVFDLLVLNGQSVMEEPLSTRRALLREQVLTSLHEPIRESPELSASGFDPVLRGAKKRSGMEFVLKRGIDIWNRWKSRQAAGAQAQGRGMELHHAADGCV